MQTRSIVSALGIIGAIAATPAGAAGNLVKFERGIGVDPVAGIVNGAPAPNIVKGVNPGGRIWVIEKLKATIRENGTISVKGEGLVLGATDAIGTVGGVTQVAASLFCGADRFDSQAVPIDRLGDFRIGGSLNVTPPSPCTTPVLLIRNAPGGVLGAWFAAGVQGDDAD
jgi:hypothetical protein